MPKLAKEEARPGAKMIVGHFEFPNHKPPFSYKHEKASQRRKQRPSDTPYSRSTRFDSRCTNTPSHEFLPQASSSFHITRFPVPAGPRLCRRLVSDVPAALFATVPGGHVLPLPEVVPSVPIGSSANHAQRLHGRPWTRQSSDLRPLHQRLRILHGHLRAVCVHCTCHVTDWHQHHSLPVCKQ